MKTLKLVVSVLVITVTVSAMAGDVGNGNIANSPDQVIAPGDTGNG